ncbi:MAG: bifunctional methylenetetrahydrofolate dehydrogenase/methenyltetrahydrofolate cyclohydrolase FolD [Myxococcales bacterium]|nr:bifunctional methylenetetrahydrofolate dehydrogenase/methenyltetrahydrofolate cyclohydrolase FolD [Myxococcales bacterium]
MTARLLDGKALAAQVRDGLRAEVAALADAGARPGLAVILAGDDPASAVYVRHKEKAAAEIGVLSRVIRLPNDVDAATVRAHVDALNADAAIHGILIQLPLPASVGDPRPLLERVHPDKDVDGFHPVNMGRLALGEPALVACTPAGCMRLLASAEVPIAGRHAVVVGRSNIVGKPMALLLLGANATVTICHSRTPDLAAEVRRADIVVVAVGRARLVKGDWLKPGATVIDVGMNRGDDGKLCGDVDFASAQAVAGAITPVPGGVGPMTIACLLDNVCRAARRALGKDQP